MKINNTKFLPGQYCWFKIKFDDGAPLSKIGQVIDMDHNGERCLVYWNGCYFSFWANELEHLYGEENT